MKVKYSPKTTGTEVEALKEFKAVLETLVPLKVISNDKDIVEDFDLVGGVLIVELNAEYVNKPLLFEQMDGMSKLFSEVEETEEKTAETLPANEDGTTVLETIKPSKEVPKGETVQTPVKVIEEEDSEEGESTEAKEGTGLKQTFDPEQVKTYSEDEEDDFDDELEDEDIQPDKYYIAEVEDNDSGEVEICCATAFDTPEAAKKAIKDADQEDADDLVVVLGSDFLNENALEIKTFSTRSFAAMTPDQIWEASIAAMESNMGWKKTIDKNNVKYWEPILHNGTVDGIELQFPHGQRTMTMRIYRDGKAGLVSSDRMSDVKRSLRWAFDDTHTNDRMFSLESSQSPLENSNRWVTIPEFFKGRKESRISLDYSDERILTAQVLDFTYSSTHKFDSKDFLVTEVNLNEPLWNMTLNGIIGESRFEDENFGSGSEICRCIIKRESYLLIFFCDNSRLLVKSAKGRSFSATYSFSEFLKAGLIERGMMNDSTRDLGWFSRLATVLDREQNEIEAMFHRGNKEFDAIVELVAEKLYFETTSEFESIVLAHFRLWQSGGRTFSRLVRVSAHTNRRKNKSELIKFRRERAVKLRNKLREEKDPIKKRILMGRVLWAKSLTRPKKKSFTSVGPRLDTLIPPIVKERLKRVLDIMDWVRFEETLKDHGTLQEAVENIEETDNQSIVLDILSEAKLFSSNPLDGNTGTFYSYVWADKISQVSSALTEVAQRSSGKITASIKTIKHTTVVKVVIEIGENLGSLRQYLKNSSLPWLVEGLITSVSDDYVMSMQSGDTKLFSEKSELGVCLPYHLPSGGDVTSLTAISRFVVSRALGVDFKDSIVIYKYPSEEFIQKLRSQKVIYSELLPAAGKYTYQPEDSTINSVSYKGVVYAFFDGQKPSVFCKENGQKMYSTTNNKPMKRTFSLSKKSKGFSINWPFSVPPIYSLIPKRDEAIKLRQVQGTADILELPLDIVSTIVGANIGMSSRAGMGTRSYEESMDYYLKNAGIDFSTSKARIKKALEFNEAIWNEHAPIRNREQLARTIAQLIGRMTFFELTNFEAMKARTYWKLTEEYAVTRYLEMMTTDASHAIGYYKNSSEIVQQIAEVAGKSKMGDRSWIKVLSNKYDATEESIIRSFEMTFKSSPRRTDEVKDLTSTVLQYSDLISTSKLFSSPGYKTSIHIGEKLTTYNGIEVEITDMFIFADGNPSVQVEYKYSIPGGKSGKEYNNFEVFMKLVRGDSTRKFSADDDDLDMVNNWEVVGEFERTLKTKIKNISGLKNLVDILSADSEPRMLVHDLEYNNRISGMVSKIANDNDIDVYDFTDIVLAEMKDAIFNVVNKLKKSKDYRRFSADSELSEAESSKTISDILSKLKDSEKKESGMLAGGLQGIIDEHANDAKTVGDLIKVLEDKMKDASEDDAGKFKMFLGNVKHLAKTFSLTQSQQNDAEAMLGDIFGELAQAAGVDQGRYKEYMDAIAEGYATIGSIGSYFDDEDIKKIHQFLNRKGKLFSNMTGSYGVSEGAIRQVEKDLYNGFKGLQGLIKEHPKADKSGGTGPLYNLKNAWYQWFQGQPVDKCMMTASIAMDEFMEGLSTKSFSFGESSDYGYDDLTNGGSDKVDYKRMGDYSDFKGLVGKTAKTKEGLMKITRAEWDRLEYTINGRGVQKMSFMDTRNTPDFDQILKDFGVSKTFSESTTWKDYQDFLTQSDATTVVDYRASLKKALESILTRNKCDFSSPVIQKVIFNWTNGRGDLFTQLEVELGNMWRVCKTEIESLDPLKVASSNPENKKVGLNNPPDSTLPCHVISSITNKVVASYGTMKEAAYDIMARNSRNYYSTDSAESKLFSSAMENVRDSVKNFSYEPNNQYQELTLVKGNKITFPKGPNLAFQGDRMVMVMGPQILLSKLGSYLRSNHKRDSSKNILGNTIWETYIGGSAKRSRSVNYSTALYICLDGDNPSIVNYIVADDIYDEYLKEAINDINSKERVIKVVPEDLKTVVQVSIKGINETQVSLLQEDFKLLGLNLWNTSSYSTEFRGRESAEIPLDKVLKSLDSNSISGYTIVGPKGGLYVEGKRTYSNTAPAKRTFKLKTFSSLGSQSANPQMYDAATSRKPYSRGRNGSPVLPCGALNLQSGANKYFNVKEDGGGTLELWEGYSERTGEKGYHVVCTSGLKPVCSIGQRSAFCNDQSGRPLFSGIMVDYCDAATPELLIPVVGSSKVPMYVYK